MIKMTEKDSSKRRFPNLKEFKKTIAVGGLIASFAIVGIISGIIIFRETPKVDILYFLGYGLPYTLDPIDVTDPKDSDVINLVAEGLFDIDENSEIIKCLATGYEWSTDDLNLTCTLREGVKFHDGTPFNATAVKWNVDRAYRLINIIPFSFLWLLPDGMPIINETQVLDEYTVKFILNAPYAPLLSLFASTYSAILSPNATPADEFIDMENGDLVGTGPFKYDFYVPDDNLTLSKNPYYWGHKPKIDKLIFLLPKISVDKALLSGKIHIKKRVQFNESTLNSFLSNRSFTISDPIPLPYLDFIVMNNKLINITMRKSISYAFNYSNYLLYPWYVNAKGPIPESILYHNISGIKVPYYNITIARQTLKDGNWPGTETLTVNEDISPGNEWELLANSKTYYFHLRMLLSLQNFHP